MLGSLPWANEKHYFQRLVKLKKNFLHLNIKGQMNQKFDIFYFSSILVKYV